LLEIQRQRRFAPVNLRGWIPRFLKYRFVKIPVTKQRDIQFMVASSISGRPNVVPRAPFVEGFLSRLKENSGNPNSFPHFILDVLGTKAERVPIPGTC